LARPCDLATMCGDCLALIAIKEDLSSAKRCSMKAPSSQRIECTRRLLNPPLRILVVSARSLIRAGLRLLIESRPDLQLAGEAASHSRAVAVAYRDKPDLILVDGHTSTSKLIAAIRELTAAAGSRILVFDGEYRPDVHREAVRNGAEDMVILDR